jgi:hypothetical protein
MPLVEIFSFQMHDTFLSGLSEIRRPVAVMYSHGLHVDVTDLEQSPVVEMQES